MKTHIFTRKELYDLVWQTPMTKLSKEVGLSDQGLAKLCRRRHIPIPPRGYWAKHAAGQKVTQTPLPELADDVARDPIVIEQVDKALTKPRPEVVKALASTPTPDISVPRKLVKPHPVVSRWRDEREASIQRNKRWQAHLPVSMRDHSRKPFTNLEMRRHRILDTIFKAIEKCGYKVGPGSYDQSWELTYEGIPVEFNITERYKQVKMPLTKEELVEPWNRGKTHKIERQFSGRLMLNIKTWLPRGLATRWAEENDEHTLEEDVPDIVRIFKAAGPLLVEQKREREDQRRRDDEERSRRHREAQRIKADEECWERFIAASNRSQEAARVRELIQRIEEMAATQDSTIDVDGKAITEWIQWAKGWAVRHDPLSGNIVDFFARISEPKNGSPWLI
ncbi:hypothetical protein PHACT_06040 [Pseudohongiella acticola]|uniref:Uncharacterized protein n=1 Tax=Pseudohongiella acticola TaxID=1524254 RepID=A0A1E8CKB1_9GAMM|nr:hypothetical protein [Pseudohongiella acticola]OFE12752.1 hypothetical protein PHACT_06040 [Pseudohongiella acticola]